MIGSPRLMYEHTNESLEAITIGLDVQPDDVVLAVCGSGDQSFALLENAKTVVSVDKSKVQLGYAERRAQLLGGGKLDEFLYVRGGEWPDSILEQRNLYFMQDGRLGRTADNLDSLHFVRGDIFAVGLDRQRRFPEVHFSKVYLSNIVAYYVTQLKTHYNRLNALSRRLPQGGLIYISNYDGLETLPNSPAQLHVDERLTMLARGKENKDWWTPVVYRKI